MVHFLFFEIISVAYLLVPLLAAVSASLSRAFSWHYRNNQISTIPKVPHYRHEITSLTSFWLECFLKLVCMRLDRKKKNFSLASCLLGAFGRRVVRKFVELLHGYVILYTHTFVVRLSTQREHHREIRN